jgi:hypothetical protein
VVASVGGEGGVRRALGLRGFQHGKQEFLLRAGAVSEGLCIAFCYEIKFVHER